MLAFSYFSFDEFEMESQTGMKGRQMGVAFNSRLCSCRRLETKITSIFDQDGSISIAPS